ncbi:MAG: S8 family serine peptidase [Pseudomonadota bacterium]
MAPFQRIKISLLGFHLATALFAASNNLAAWSRAVTGNESVNVVVKMGQPLNLADLKGLSDEPRHRSLQIAKALEIHLKKELEKQAPWLKQGAAEGVEEMTPLWLVGAVRVRAKPSAIEKLLIVKGSSSMAIEKAKPIHHSFDSYATLHSTEPTERIEPEEIGWGVRKIGAPEAWKLGAEGEGVTVAVLDSGINVNHPDLQGNIWTNPGETGLDADGNDRATNGVDDDQNGYVDDVYGWNFEENSSDISDYLGHGTQAAGIIAGQGSGGTHTGVAPKAKVMTLRSCCMLGGEVAESAIWEAVQYAMKQGAQVLSMSVSLKHWGKPNYVFWRRASEVLNAAKIIHVNSAGNRGHGNEPYNIGAPGSNPPAWLHPLQSTTESPLSSMITVGAVDFEDHLRSYSSVGPVTWEDVTEYQDFPYNKGQKKGLIKPDLCAPSETPSLSMDGVNYTLSFGGTSSSTPHVAGAVALLLSANPKLTVAQVTESLQMSAVPVGGEFTNRCGAGRLNVLAAIEYVRRGFK